MKPDHPHDNLQNKAKEGFSKKADKRAQVHEQHTNHFTSRADNRSNTETVE